MSYGTIRTATVADVPLLFDIRLSVTENAMSMEDMAARGVTHDSIGNLLSDQSRAWVAELDGRPAGFALANSADAGLYAMFVRPQAQGRGLGGMLMAEAEAFLFENHHAIWLTTGAEPRLRAHGFYRRLGWRVAGLAEHDELRYEKIRTEGQAA